MTDIEKKCGMTIMKGELGEKMTLCEQDWKQTRLSYYHGEYRCDVADKFTERFNHVKEVLRTIAANEFKEEQTGKMLLEQMCQDHWTMMEKLERMESQDKGTG